MQVTGSNSGESISVQISLSGYVSRICNNGVSVSSGWMSADRFFTDPQFGKRYDEVSVSVFTPKFTLVPEQFFDPVGARTMLAGVSELGDADYVAFEPLPQLKAVLIYSNSIGETLSKAVAGTVLRTDGEKSRILPEIWYMLDSLESVRDYNKVIAAFADGHLYLVAAQGRSLLLCNVYEAADFVTAEYFIFLAMKKLQLNPEMTTLYFRTPLADEEELSLYRYFRSVDYI
ncbi:MAG TPA: DUF3822 family protein [Candidatus Cryptobacteroides intestinipullorum]|nr:DUF3822 family protein [Candidatus Cryptobacteroides intestinipullorum]